MHQINCEKLISFRTFNAFRLKILTISASVFISHGKAEYLRRCMIMQCRIALLLGIIALHCMKGMEETFLSSLTSKAELNDLSGWP